MQKNYFKLLEEEQKLKKINERLSLEKKQEFVKYENEISDHFTWKQKNNFLEVIINFLEDMIDLDSYARRLYEINSQIEESIEKLKSDFEELEAFEPDSSSRGFATLIDNLLSDLRILEKDDELRTEDEISEETLKNEIKRFLPKIQEY